MSKENKPEELPNELPRRKWWLPVLIGMVVVAGLVYGGRKLYTRLEPERLARNAKLMIEKGDHRGAFITLSRALQINNNSRSATKAMVELMDKLNLPQALEWHRRLIELSPDSAEDAMALAQFALKQKNPELASHVLGQLPPNLRANADFQTVSGLTAIQTGKWQAARDFFTEAARLSPDDVVIRYNLALAQIQSTDATERDTGWNSLEALGKSGRAQSFALRTLITRYAREDKFDDAIARSETLMKLSDAKFQDFLVHAELLRHLKRPEWTAALDRAKAAAEDVPAEASAMVNWFRLNQQPEEGLQWAAKLDPAITDSSQVAAARAECLLVTKQWDRLMRLAKPRPWPGLDHLRFAFLARAQAEKGEQVACAGSWSDAVAACHGNRDCLVQLVGVGANWRWVPQTREALWAATDAASPDWALDLLYQSYASEKNTAEMLRVARKMAACHPDQLPARNNVALFSMLVHQDPQEALTIARDLVSKEPQNQVFRSTFAFALLANGMPEECLTEMESLNADSRKDSNYAPYFAFAYQANGDLAQAREFLTKVDRKQLLPEETALVEKLGALN
jgi:tetratricopeptide (TPR) repeat protein